MCNISNCERELVYKTIGEKNLLLTFLPPVNVIYEKSPLVFLISGGGWHYANRVDMINFPTMPSQELRDNGFAIVSIDYRTVNNDKAIMEEILQDCNDALDFVVFRSNELGIDRERIVVAGHSAGAHLSLMLAYKKDIQCNISAVVSFSAPTILYKNDTHNLRDIDEVFSPEKIDESKKNTSPYEHVTSNCPPTFLCAGTSDYLVFANSSELLYKKLLENKVECELVLSIGGGHCFEKVHDTIEPGITLEDVRRKTFDFIMKHMV